MALVAQVRGLDSTLSATKTVVGSITTLPVASHGDMIQGWDGSSYVYYNGTAALDSEFSAFVDLTAGGNFDNYVLVSQGGAGGGNGFRLSIGGDGQYRFTFGGVADYSFGSQTPNTGIVRLGFVYRRTAGFCDLYLNGVFKASEAVSDMSSPPNTSIVIGAAYNGSSFSDITDATSGRYIGNVDIYDTAFDATEVANEYVTYLDTGVTKALTGQAITAQQGNLADTVSKSLIGQVITVNQGSLVDTVNPMLSGQQINSGQGNVSAGGDVTKAITGQEITTGQGNLSDVVSKGITGQSITASQGTLSDNVAIDITGQQINSQQGSLSIGGDIVKALTGQQINVQQGQLSAPQTESLFGGVAHFKNLNDQNKKNNAKRQLKALETQDNVEYDAVTQDVVVTAPKVVKKRIIEKLITTDDRELIQSQLRDEMIKEYLLIVQAKQQEEEQAIVMMMLALI